MPGGWFAAGYAFAIFSYLQRVSRIGQIAVTAAPTNTIREYRDADTPNGAGNVWAKLVEASEHRSCASPPCTEGRHIHQQFDDFGEEMAHVEGAVVVRRPNLIDEDSPLLAPAGNLDFARTLMPYFPLFRSSLCPRTMPEHTEFFGGNWTKCHHLEAIQDEDDLAMLFANVHYEGTEGVAKRARDGSIPTAASMEGVFIDNMNGFVWNDQDFVVPTTCQSEEAASVASTGLLEDVQSYDKVVVLTTTFGSGFYHFLVESLSRITAVLDVILENPHIKVAAHPAKGHPYPNTTIIELLGLLGIEEERVILEPEIRADLAIIPSSTPCGHPNEATINILRHALLQALYPATAGVPPTLDRPVLLLIVRSSKRGLKNNDEVREALKLNFPSFEVVEFFGDGSVESQLKMFATASAIVGPHGAGLSNMVVSPLRTPVLEIAATGCPYCYTHLAIKLQHIYVRHQALRPRHRIGAEECNFWYRPRVDDVIRSLSDLLEAKRDADAAGP